MLIYLSSIFFLSAFWFCILLFMTPVLEHKVEKCVGTVLSLWQAAPRFPLGAAIIALISFLLFFLKVFIYF